MNPGGAQGRAWRPGCALLVFASLVLASSGFARADPPAKAEGAVRIATFNASLSRRDPGRLAQELRLGGSPQIDAVAEIIQRVRPDAILINEIDWDRRGVALSLFQDTLRDGRGGAAGLDFPYAFTAPVNTGVATGYDLDGDGRQSGPRDAYGFGYFEGQYGMAILSRLPFDDALIRRFQTLKWIDAPGALIPKAHFGEAAAALRLSSKSHWDAPVILPDGRRLHLLASHPTPPVFDGPEDANGRRNHDEIAFWVDYILGRDWMRDDAGAAGALPDDAAFVVLGDLNADPFDGSGLRASLLALLALTSDPGPMSAGGRLADAGIGANRRHRGDPALDTADWRDEPGPGNLRVDFVLPSKDLEVLDAGVFWPAADTPLGRLVARDGRRHVSSDHRLVWVDLR